MSSFLQPHGLQYTRISCPLLSPGVCSNSYPLNQYATHHLNLCCPLLLLPLIFPSIRIFSNESSQKVASFSFSILSSNEYSGLISFRIDWFDLLAVQGSLKSLLQHHNSKASVLWPSLWSNSHIHTRLLEKSIGVNSPFKCLVEFISDLVFLWG